MTQPDPQDQPEPEGMSLVVPFVACQSQDGPYDDDAFCAGFQAGEVDAYLAVAAVSRSRRVGFTVRKTLLRQLELIGMHRGFPTMHIEESDEWPEWALVTFAATGEDVS